MTVQAREMAAVPRTARPRGGEGGPCSQCREVWMPTQVKPEGRFALELSACVCVYIYIISIETCMCLSMLRSSRHCRYFEQRASFASHKTLGNKAAKNMRQVP